MRKPSRDIITLTIYGDRAEHVHNFPARWEICPACDGHATTTRHIECDGGGFTGEEWAEACREDEEFAEKYFGGFYDRPCPDCKGLGRVQVIDEERVTGRWEKKLLNEYHRQQRDFAEIDRISEMERRMGA